MMYLPHFSLQLVGAVCEIMCYVVSCTVLCWVLTFNFS